MDPNKKAGQFFERKLIANQIKQARKSESNKGMDAYTFDRNGKEYLCRIGGLEHLFKYLKGLPSHKVLDVGAGNGKASSKISQMPISAGLDLEVTALRNNPELTKNFPVEKTHITEVERKRNRK
jgi:hypothetical protein